MPTGLVTCGSCGIPATGIATTNAIGWSIRLRPTPGEFTWHAMPSAASSSRGPIPDRIRIAGEFKAPAESVTRRPAHFLDRSRALDFDSHRLAILDCHAMRVDAAANREIHAMA